jgi:3-oxoacyl-(acyl-carrier-protein) synthase
MSSGPLHSIAHASSRVYANIPSKGTGTQAGDVKEMEALAKTIAAFHTAESKLIVGSVKSNVS